MSRPFVEVVHEEEAARMLAPASAKQATNRAIKAPPICLDFQQVLVSAPFGRIDQKDAQKVRAHVMRQHHQKRRKDSGKNVEILQIEEHVQEAVEKPARKPVKRKVVAPRRTTKEVGKFVQFQPRIPSPQTRSSIGAGRWDPFLQIPMADIPKGYHELVDHCITVFWPGSFGTSYSLDFARDMIPKFAGHPLCLWSTLFTSASHLEGLRAKQIIDSDAQKKASIEQLERKVSTLHAVNAALKDETSNKSDELILTILILASSEEPDQLKPADWSPFDAPLRSMQWVDIRGKRVYYKPHVKAMQSLIQKRGGLRNIKMFGVSCVISSLELTWCAASLSPPTHPLLDPLGRDIVYTPFVVDDIPLPLANHLDPEIPSGFSHLAELHLYPALRVVLLRLKQYSDMVQLHINGSDLPDNMLENRNWVFHNLLNIPAASTLPHQDFGAGDALKNIEWVYETCRLGAIMYSIHVIYPTPRSRSPRERLLPLLKEVIGRMDLLTLDRPSTELILWCLVVGGIAATGSTDRSWFVMKLKALCVVLSLTHWSEIKVVMRQFSWVESACDFGGEALLDEVLSLSRSVSL